MAQTENGVFELHVISGEGPCLQGVWQEVSVSFECVRL
ncbi:Unknown protein sequence [Pseudomonas syringae pv. cilantro]|uniref:Uncharacterized protein n=1 Tax=Pseudomonas syringae pv. cilantro TaxID=81035 RepID=A0A0N0GHK1_PSESX|nr:Unknown protein sequence [Pseudomonas syringae pv. cilantro]